jgi:hypothetical protein
MAFLLIGSWASLAHGDRVLASAWQSYTHGSHVLDDDSPVPGMDNLQAIFGDAPGDLCGSGYVDCGGDAGGTVHGTTVN